MKLLVSAFICIVWTTIALSQAGPPSGWSPSIQTTGGVTYLVGTATLLGCHQINFSRVSVTGNNLQMTVDETVFSPCTQCRDCYYTNLTATVLGQLSPGSYELLLYAPAGVGLPPTLWLVVDFDVPVQSGPTLTLSADGTQAHVDVNGAAAATYVLQGSATLADWTSIYTNSGRDFHFSTNITHGAFQFYRAQITSGVIPASP